MSKNIEEEVLQMRFENGQFERAAGTSLKTLDKLKESLSFKGIEKGFERVEESVKKVDFSILERSAEAVKSKFSALEVVAVTALANITNSAVNTGKRLISSLTVDNIAAGWGKLEQKTTSVATLISQGYDMSTVEQQLSRLNWYTDETSYNFTAMADSISKFTASDESLDESTTALMGIANWAALSGQNASTASRAMYQISQAMGAGIMRKEDYMSIQNASMDTDEFRQKALDAAVALKTLKKNADGTYQSLLNPNAKAFSKSQFANHLTEDVWFTSDVMMKVFTDYSAAVDRIYDYASEKGVTASEAIEELGSSVDEFGLKAFRAAQEAKTWTDVLDSVKDAVGTGWMNSFEAIFGNYEEQRVLWTDLANAMYDVFASSAEGRNELLGGWKELGGRTALIEGFWNVWNNAVATLDTVKEAFREIFPKTTAEQLFKITEKIRDFASKLALNEERTRKLKNVLKGLFSVIKLLVDVVKSAVTLIFSLAKNLSWVADLALDAASAIGEWLGGVRESAEQSRILSKILNEVGNVLAFVFDKIRAVVDAVRELNWNWLNPLCKVAGNTVRWLIGNIGDLYLALKEKLSSEELRSLGQKLVGVLRWICDQINAVFTAIGNLFSVSGIDSVTGTVGALYNILSKLGNLAVSVGKKIGAALGELFADGNISNILDIVNGGLLAAILSNLKKFTSNITGMLGSFSETFGSVGDILSTVKDTLVAWQKDIRAGTILKLAKAIAILAASLLVISLINSEKLTGALAAMTMLFAKLALSIRFLGKSKFDFAGIAKTIGFMLSFSASVLILSVAMAKLGSLDWEGIAKGVVGISALTLVITASAKMLSKIDGKVIKGAGSLIIFSSAVAILAAVTKSLAQLNLAQLIKGLSGVALLSFTMQAVAKSLSKIDGKIVKGAGSLIIFSSAVAILAAVCKSLSAVDVGSLIKGVAGMAAVTAVALTSAKILSKIDGRVVKGASSLVIFSSAIAVLAAVCKKLSSLQWEELVKGLTGIVGITAAILLVSKAKTSFAKGAVSFIAVGAAMAVIAEVIKKLGAIETKHLSVGFAAFAGSLIALAIGLKAMKGSIGGAAALTIAVTALMPLALEMKMLSTIPMSGIAKALISMAGAFIVIGIAAKCLKPIVGTMTKVAGAIALFGTGCALAGAGILAVSVALTTLSVSLVTMGASIGSTLSCLFDGIAESVDSLRKMTVEISKALCSALAEIAPELSSALLTLVLEVLKSINGDIPLIVDTVTDIITQVLERLSVKIPKIIESLANVLKEIAGALNTALGNDGWEKLLLSITAISGVMLAIAATAKIISSIKLKGMGQGLAGLAAAVAGIIGIVTVVGALAQMPGLDRVINDSAKIFAGIGNVLGALVSGLINGLVANFPQDFSAIINACAGIEIIALALTPLSTILGKLDIKGTAKGMAGFAIVVGGLTVILSVLAALNQIPGFTDFLSSGGDVLCKIAEILGQTIGTFVDNLSKSVTSGIGEVMNSLISVGAIISAVAVVAKIVGKLKIDPASVATGFLGVATAIGCIALILTALGALKQIPGFEWIIGEGGEFLCKLGSILGEFVGSIISGIGVGLTSGLQKIGQNLSDFMIAVTPFIDGVKNVDDRVMKGVSTLAGAILALTAANLLDGIASFLLGGRSISKFGKEIGDFGVSLKIFSDNVSGINVSAVEAASTAGKLLAEMTHTIPRSDGVAQFFAGNKSLAKFSREIGDFGKGISAFSKNSANIKPAEAKAAAEVGKILAEMTNTLPNENGVAQFFAGSNSFASFSNGIGDFGTGISVFAANVSKMPDNIDKVKAAAEAGKILAEMTKTLPDEGGLAQFFAGEKSLASFSNGIGDFGIGITAFAEKVANMPDDTEKVKAAAEAGKLLAEMTNTLPSENGIEQWFSGEKSLAKFGTDIGNLGEAVLQFSDSAKNIDKDKTMAAVDAATAIAEMTNTLPSENGIAQWFTGSKNLSSLGKEMEDLGHNVAAFSNAVADIDTSRVSTATGAVKNVADALAALPENIDGDFGTTLGTIGYGIKGFTELLSDVDTYSVSTKLSNLAAVSTKIQNDGLSGFESLSNALANVGANGVAQFNKAFDDADGTTKDSVSGFLSKTSSQIEEFKPKFKEAGTMMAKGFADGINYGNGGVVLAAEKMAQAALDAAKRKLDIHSPSKEMYKVGSWLDEGFVGGIRDGSDQVEAAGAGVAEKAKSGFSNALSKVADFFGGKIDVQPTITPVLDLSDVENKSKSIDAMFSREQAVSVKAGIAASNQTTNNSASSSSSFTFTQNITSPKAVDAKTIYRQTRNQFSRMMGVIGQV